MTENFVFIDNKKIFFEKNLTVIQACLRAGIEIPRFCYHDRLSIAGNCRMCLVEVKKSLKPVASCAMPVVEGMEILTQTSLVKKAREGVLEFLLVNHPLDCPICDQGGECDLQDQAMVFGSDRGRFYDYKRSVEDKDCGPFIKTLMTRCIHCTRCIRFLRELGGLYDFGTTGRGGKMEVGTYISKNLNSEVSGNIIDLCPVGALTSKPYAFLARSWELNHVNSIDIFDSFGSNIRIDFRGSEIMRVLPRLNESLNEEWLSDTCRFNYDGLKYQRLSFPMVKIKSNNRPVEISWEKAFNIFRFKLLQKKIFKKDKKRKLLFNLCIGDSLDCESSFLVVDLFRNFDCIIRKFYENYDFNLNVDFRENYLSDNFFKNINSNDLFLFLGTDLRIESPLLNLHFKKNSNRSSFLVASVGYNLNLGYKVYNLGNSLKVFLKLLEGRHWFCNFLSKSNSIKFLVGCGFIGRKDNALLLNSINKLNDYFFFNKKKNNLNHVFTSPNQSGFYELGLNFDNNFLFKSFNNYDYFQFFYLFNFNKPLKLSTKIKNNFVIYQGFHGDIGASNADLLFPNSSFIEKNGFFLNNFGYLQESKQIFKPFGNSLLDWQILIGLGDSLLFFNDYKNLINVRRKLFSISPLLVLKDDSSLLTNYNSFNFFYSKFLINYKSFFINSLFSSVFYNHQSISYNTINKLSNNLNLSKKNFYKNYSNFYI